MKRTLTLVTLLAIAPGSIAQAQNVRDWPQWGGPSRDFTLPAGAPIPAWGADGPRRLWSRAIGDGFSAIVTSGNRGFTTYRDGDADVALAFDLATGGTAWEVRTPAPFRETCSHRLGPVPRAAPLVSDGRLFTASAGGLLTAIDAATGAISWQRDLVADSRASLRACGYSSSPVAYGETVIVITGVAGRSIMAFNAKDGTVAWQRHDFPNGYSSPIIATVFGRPELVALMAQVVVGLDPSTGALRWQHPHPTADDVNVAMPIVTAEGLVVLSSGYDGGTRVLALARDGDTTTVTQLWEHKRFRVHFGTMARLQDLVLGSNGDFGPAPLTAVDIKTGKVLWRDRVVARASFVLVGDRALILDEDGLFVLAAISAAGVTVEAKGTLPALLNAQCWTPPTIAGDVLLVRNRNTIAAFALR